MSDLPIVHNPMPAAHRPVPQLWLIITIALLVVIGAFVIGHYFGYRSGYQAGYVPEHSHFIFEQKRARALQKRIADQRRCIDQHVRGIPSIDAAGFAGLGELFRNVALLYVGTRLCDGASGFGVPTQSELRRIFPSGSN